MELKDATVVILVCVLSYATCIGSVPTCTNYRPIRMYGNWCFKYQLHWAALAGHMEEVTRLIDDGADVNQLTQPGRWTPLHFAANYGRANAVDRLLSKGANPELRSSDNFTPRHRAQAKYCKGYRANTSCGLSSFNYNRSIRILLKAEKKLRKSNKRKS